MREIPLSKRFLFKLSTNVIGLFFLFIQQAIAPRLLGPIQYGNFSFLKSFFDQFIAFFDSGTSIGFFTKLSQRPHEVGLKAFYWMFILMVTILSAIALILLSVCKASSIIWPGQSNRYIWLGFGCGIAFLISNVSSKVMDAHGLTIEAEIWRLLQKIIATVIIVGLFLFNTENLSIFFIYHILTLLLLTFGWGYILIKKHRIPLVGKSHFNRQSIQGYPKEFWTYSSPLITYMIFGLLSTAGDRWLLQYFYGSIEQAYYGLAFQASFFCFIFISTLTPLFTRDFSRAYSENNFPRMQALLQNLIPLFYSIASYFSIFIAANATAITHLIGGSKYLSAAPILALMAIYPLHQTYGRLCSGVFYSTNQTKLYRNIGILGMSFGMILSALFILPKKYGCLQLGAYGLALKMLIYQFVTVNVQLWFNCKSLNLPFKFFVKNQLYMPLTLICCAYISNYTASKMLSAPLFHLLLNGILYTLITLPILYLFIPNHYKKILQNYLGYLRLLSAKKIIYNLFN